MLFNLPKYQRLYHLDDQEKEEERMQMKMLDGEVVCLHTV